MSQAVPLSRSGCSRHSVCSRLGDATTGRATKIVDLVGSNSVMGLAFGREGNMYATDNPQNPGLYLIDIDSGFETAIAALPFGFSSGLELANPPEAERTGVREP